MLVLSRKRETSIHIGPDVRVAILDIRGNQVKVGVEAPAAIPVWRTDALGKIGRTPELQEREDEAPSDKTPFKVLLVEDDPGARQANLQNSSRVPPDEAYRSGCRPDGRTRRGNRLAGRVPTRHARCLAIDLILLDLYLPRMTGWNCS